jgi:hypothetical protein
MDFRTNRQRHVNAGDLLEQQRTWQHRKVAVSGIGIGGLCESQSAGLHLPSR